MTVDIKSVDLLPSKSSRSHCSKNPNSTLGTFVVFPARAVLVLPSSLEADIWSRLLKAGQTQVIIEAMVTVSIQRTKLLVPVIQFTDKHFVNIFGAYPIVAVLFGQALHYFFRIGLGGGSKKCFIPLFKLRSDH